LGTPVFVWHGDVRRRPVEMDFTPPTVRSSRSRSVVMQSTRMAVRSSGSLDSPDLPVGRTDTHLLVRDYGPRAAQRTRVRSDFFEWRFAPGRTALSRKIRVRTLAETDRPRGNGRATSMNVPSHPVVCPQ
jgi:hypothetical protein